MIVTYDEFLQFLQVSPESQDQHEVEILEDYLKLSQDIIERYCNRKFEKAIFTEYKSGQDYNIINLLNYPVDSTAEITLSIRSEVGESFTEINTNDYVVDYEKGQVHYPGGFPIGFKNIKIVYTGGFETVPSAIVLAIKSIGKILFEKKDQNAIGLIDYHAGDAITKYDNSVIPLDIRRILNTYKNWTFR